MLSCYPRFLLAVSLVLGTVLGFLGAASAPHATAEQIARWIKQLGDDRFAVRENASKKLWQAGAAAESVLEKAVHSDDPEVVRRARELLDKFRWGIYPDTPADIVALIRAYQSSDGNARGQVVDKLLDAGDAGLRALLKIVTAEKNENQRNWLRKLIASKLPGVFLQAVTEAKYEKVEKLLELGHEGQLVRPIQYAAYWLLRGQLKERIAHMRARWREHPEDKWTAETLAYLHRANGDPLAARQAAEKAGRADLLEGILYEAADWKALAGRAESPAAEKDDNGVHHVGGAENPAEKWAYRAAFARLAGKQKQFDNAIRKLRKFAEDKEDREGSAFVAAKGLLLNDRPAEASDILRNLTLPDYRTLHFDLLCARLDFTAALDLGGKEVPTDKEIPHLDLARARLLCLLADKEGEALFDRYGKRIRDGIDPEWVKSLLAEEIRAGLKDRAFAHAAKAMTVAPPKKRGGIVARGMLERFYVAQLFPQQTKTAEVWWTVLRRQLMDEPPKAVLKRLRQLLEGKVAAKTVKSWIEKAGPRAAERQALAEAAAKVGLDDLAATLLIKADSRDALLRLGDLLAAKKQWDKAAQRYRQAWDKELQEMPRHKQQRFPSAAEEKPPDPLPLYLAGDALVRAGQEQEGKELIEQSHWVPFADTKTRLSFLSALAQRGRREAARREAELLLRVSEPNSFYSGEGLRRRAIAAHRRKEYLQAAEGLEQSMLRCLSPRIRFVSNAAYANVPAQVHQLRARGLLAAGKVAEALHQAELALTDSPGYVDLAIMLVPELERLGHKKEATELFNRCYGAYEKVCRAYPRCAWARNSAAWLSACCRRNLDKALHHAQKAVELAPKKAGYIDTLAEVHFQRGDKDKAIALQKRAIELDPKKMYYRKQLKRIQAGDPSAERPPENEEE